MSGHNKWSQIKTKKTALDAKKSKAFSILARQITLEAQTSGGDRSAPKLRAVILRAHAANMPNANIDRAVEKGSGSGGAAYETVRYEAYGPGGVAILIEGITDNKNRTTAEIKHLLAEHGGNLGAVGSALWAFEKADSGWRPTAPIPVSPADSVNLIALVEALETHDDIESVVTNAAAA